MKNKFLIALTAFLFTGLSMYAQESNPQSLKVGYASVNYILTQMPDYESIEKEMQEYEQQLTAEMQSQYQELQDKANKYQQSAETMLPELREQKEKELRELQARIERFQREAQQRIQKKESDLLSPAYDKIQQNIDVVAAKNGFSHVLNSEVSGVPTLLYVSDESNDISNLVLQNMGITPQDN